MNQIITYITRSLQDIYPPRELQSLIRIVCKDLLQLNEVDIYLRKDIKLSGNKQLLLERAIERLKQHEPIQYVLGRTEFYKLPFRVAPGVLIPRPETEELVELIIQENSGQLRILDIGTGSGCIAISLAHHLPEATVEAWDVSVGALDIARDNAGSLGVNVRFFQKDVLSVTGEKEQYHVIVSNPPYIAEEEKKVMDKNVLDWEPELALFVPDDDPLCFYRCIAELGSEMLVKGGKLYFEINQAYGPDVAGLLEQLNYSYICLKKDLFGNNRMISAVK